MLYALSLRRRLFSLFFIFIFIHCFDYMPLIAIDDRFFAIARLPCHWCLLASLIFLILPLPPLRHYADYITLSCRYAAIAITPPPLFRHFFIFDYYYFSSFFDFTLLIFSFTDCHCFLFAISYFRHCHIFISFFRWHYYFSLLLFISRHIDI